MADEPSESLLRIQDPHYRAAGALSLGVVNAAMSGVTTSFGAVDTDTARYMIEHLVGWLAQVWQFVDYDVQQLALDIASGKYYDTLEEIIKEHEQDEPEGQDDGY